VTFTFYYNAEDYCAAQMLYQRKKHHARLVLSVIQIAGLILIASYLYVRHESQLAIPMLAGGLVGICFPFLHRWRFKREFRRLPLLQQRVELTITPEGVFSKTPNGEGKTNWHAFERWHEDQLALLLLLKGSKTFFFFPKRLLTEEQAQHLRSLFTQQLTR
jgi:hypothetical protein